MDRRADWIDLADERQRAAWHDLLAAAPDATSFHQPPFAEAYGEVFDVRAAGVWEGDRLVCGTWLFGKRGRRSVVPPMCAYASPVNRTTPRDADVHHRRTPLDLLLAFVQQEFNALAFHLPPSVADARPYAWSGFENRVLYTYRLALGSPDEMRARLSRVRRRSLSDVVPEYATGAELTEGVAASYRRQNHRLPLPRQVLNRLADQWADSFESWRADDAVALAASHRNEAYDVLSGGVESSPEGRTSLLWAMLCMLAERGVTTYDLCGANTPSIAEFKRTMGADLVPYIRTTWHRPGLARTVARVRPLV